MSYVAILNAITTGLSILLLVETLAFVIVYAIGSPWKRSLIGRTVMYLAVSMLILLSYEFVENWIEIPYDVRRTAAVVVFAFLVLMWGRMFLALRYAQKGLISADNPNYSPFRDWLARRRTKAENTNQ